ncbi:oligosaccharide flippase family protein [Patescibacteria group bacterium]
MSELDLKTVRKRSVAGVVALTSRTFFLQMVNFGAMFLLTIFLAPEIFGIFFVVTAAVNFLNYFSDIGLAAALIQKKEKLTESDLKTTFTIQQVLVIFLAIIALLGSSLVARFYRLDQAGLWLFRALVFSFFLSSLKTIPSVLLERKLDFNRLVIPQIAETIFFNLIAVYLAWQGFGVASFSWAVLARGISGLILIYLLSPWKPGLKLDKKSARSLLNFGVPFQVNSLLALVKDDLLIVFLGKILPLAQVGYLGWAQKWANFPLRFIMDSVNKVTFPAYSRIQKNLPALKNGVEKALFSVCTLTFPALVGLSILASSLVENLPRYTKWQPALLSLYFFCFQACFSAVSTTLTNTLNATGRIKTTLKLMMMWTVLTWVFTPLFIIWWGYHGVALAALVVSSLVVIPVWLVKRFVNFAIWENVGWPMLGALLMGTAVYLLRPYFSQNLLMIGLLAAFGAIIYSIAMLLLAKDKVIGSVKLVAGAIKK